jgi:hypothetical protein
MTPTNPSSRPETDAPVRGALPDSAGHDLHTHDAHHARHGHADHDGLYNEDVAHEDSDVNIRQLIGYTIGLLALCLAAAAVVLVVFNMLEGQAAKADPVLSPNAIPAGQQPPEPRLLVNEPGALLKQREAEAEMLGKYGWVDQAAGVARVPIDEAKKLLLQRGVPIRVDAPADPWLGTHSPARGESSSGRAIPLRPGAAVVPPPGTPADVQPAAPHKGSGNQE